VVENSQAQDQGLLKGDLIVEYDGIMIRDSRKLVKATQKKSAAESVTITVLRDQIPMQFVLDAGFIGVRIRNQSVPNEEVDNYF
jgi:S1-C subfamily serine protease